jgi:hypothetical protein
VTVTGLLDLPDIACRFNDTVVPATFMSPTLAMCQTPKIPLISRRAAGGVTMEVTMNRQAFSQSGLRFWYYEDPVISRVWPRVSPLRVRNLVTLYSDNFPDAALPTDGLAFCRFGEITGVPAVRKSKGEVTCWSPVVEDATSTIVSVTWNNAQYSPFAATYLYYQITKVVPYSAPENQRIPIEIFGVNIDQGNAYRCKFGTKAAENGTEILVDGTLVTTQSNGVTMPALRCITPSLSGGDYILEISLSDDVFSKQNTEYAVYSPLGISHIQPNTGPAIGGNAVTIFGSGFLNGGLLSCKFEFVSNITSGEKGSIVIVTNRTTISPVQFINSTAIVCIAPKIPAGVPYNVDVSASLNAISFTSGIAYWYYSISSFHPKAGPIIGETQVKVCMPTFPLSLGYSCRFGNDNDMFSIVERAPSASCASRLGANIQACILCRSPLGAESFRSHPSDSSTTTYRK